MIRNLRGLLARTDRLYWGIGFILVLLVVVSLAWEVPVGGAGQAGLPQNNPGIYQAVFRFQEVTPTPEGLLLATPTGTPFPPELLANYKQTTGVIVFAAVLVLIIVGGVFFQLLNERDTTK
ncbi:MAG TPA: hypothetical protein PJ988_05225 [Anaerolinea sp.]|nr:hypothetical protein [Anaerolinea sp.]